MSGDDLIECRVYVIWSASTSTLDWDESFCICLITSGGSCITEAPPDAEASGDN